MVGGAMWVEWRMRVHPQYWVALGLASAGSAGLLACAFGQPYLKSLAYDLHLPLIGEVHLASVLLFDVGVYLVVVGSTMLMLVSLAHQSFRSPREPLEPQRVEG